MPINTKWYDVRLSDSRSDRLRFRMERWLLAPGSSATGRLRGYLRAKAWRDLPSARARLRAVKGAAKMPLRALRESWRAAGMYGGPVEREFGLSRRRQTLELWWLWMRYGVSQPDVYYGFRLHRSGQLSRGAHFLQADEADRLYRLLSIHTARDQAELLLDKARFEQWLADQGLPMPRTLLEFDGGQVVRSSLGDGGLPPCDLFSKPNDALKGVGTQRWRREGDGWVGEDGAHRGEEQLLAELAELSRERSLLLQEQLRNHPALRPLAPAALSTVRVLTLRGLDGMVRVILAICKIPSGNAPTDHMWVGGIAAPVDLASGRLGPAVRKDELRFVVPCERHPDTGVTIEGFQLPHWDEAMRLAVRAHNGLDRMLCIGWDIAILDRGPVIIEGNDNPGHASSQIPTGIALGETPVIPTLLARLEEAFAGRRATPGREVPLDGAVGSLQPPVRGR